MPKFDHRFDNMVQRKDQIRFVGDSALDDAEEFAIAQYSNAFVPQAIVQRIDGIEVLELVAGATYGGDKILSTITSLAGE